MLALRYAYVLSLAVWLGGAIVLTALTEDMFGVPMGRFQYFAYLCGAILIVTLSAMALLGPRPSGFAVRLGLAVGMLAAMSARLMVVTIGGGLILLYWEARDHGR